MTIRERMEREAFDRLNPWRSACEAKVDGIICELSFSDLVGTTDHGPKRYILHTDGNWIRIDVDPPEKVTKRPTCFRPIFARLTDHRRRQLAHQATRRASA